MAVQKLQSKAKIISHQTDMVIFGNVYVDSGQTPARQVGLQADLLHSSTVIVVCGSGIKAIIL